MDPILFTALLAVLRASVADSTENGWRQLGLQLTSNQRSAVVAAAATDAGSIDAPAAWRCRDLATVTDTVDPGGQLIRTYS